MGKPFSDPTHPEHRPPKGFVYKPSAGKGWGGEARDAKPFSATHNTSPDARKIGRMEAKEYREALRKRRGKILAIYDRVLEKAETSEDFNIIMQGANLGQKIDDRIDGKPSQTLQGPDGGPIPTSLAVAFVKPDATD